MKIACYTITYINVFILKLKIRDFAAHFNVNLILSLLLTCAKNTKKSAQNTLFKTKNTTICGANGAEDEIRTS